MNTIIVSFIILINISLNMKNRNINKKMSNKKSRVKKRKRGVKKRKPKSKRIKKNKQPILKDIHITLASMQLQKQFEEIDNEILKIVAKYGEALIDNTKTIDKDWSSSIKWVQKRNIKL